ncbi:nitronate monooxygenase [Agrococcus sp. Marseille-Q4369]|uniref:nitronate monooxygenase n=1 Tax=Agrococcus sp. Marseille-Q4369 TaxID=2810513 RepID=UPI001B8C91F5|nr:nitronate monooxygenase [Agrococcus sp. Marseille-Q4369]QUW17828.1 nitronate monooxygenase [Agrococcus sp. Marseille-Q4369]
MHATDSVDPQYEPALSVTIGDLTLASLVMPASGCFGPELGRLISVEEIGASVTKTVFAEQRGGNPIDRVSELPVGMINSVGIPSYGASGYLSGLREEYAELGVPSIVSVGGHRVTEYAPLVEAIGDGNASAFELNVSCPNLDAQGADIGADPHNVAQVVQAVRRVTTRPILVKMPSMLSSIADCAIAAEAAGADAVCVANSVPVLPLHERERRFALGNRIGGLSGPSIKPIVSRHVWLSAQAVSIPVVACGGVSNADDALDYLALGAKAVQVGTANFGNPMAMVQIARDLRARVQRAGAETLPALLRMERPDVYRP